MVALIDDNQSKFFDVDSDHFSNVLTMAPEETDEVECENEFINAYPGESFLAVSAPNESTTLKLSQVNKCNQRMTAKGILSLMNHCKSIRELSLPYSFLSDELLKELSNDETSHLETLRVEAHPDAKPTSNLSYEAWCMFTSRFPNLNFVLLSYLTDAKDYEPLVATHVPLTHLYFGDCAPASVIKHLGERCPRLAELVVSTYGPETIDEPLINAAKGCPRLSAIGLGDCELTCSGVIKFVSLCCDRLRVLYVSDTSLLDDSENDITEVPAKVSSLLGRSWQPNYVPCW